MSFRRNTSGTPSDYPSEYFFNDFTLYAYPLREISTEGAETKTLTIALWSLISFLQPKVSDWGSCSVSCDSETQAGDRMEAPSNIFVYFGDSFENICLI